MSFSYDVSNPNDTTRVRYHLQDTDADTAIFSDEEIAFVLSEEGSVGRAVVSLITAIMAKLSHEPDMQADWLRVSWRSNVATWARLLADKRREFGIGSGAVLTVAGRQVYRGDGEA